MYDKDLIENLEEEYKIALAIPHKRDRGRGNVTPYNKDRLYNRRSAIEANESEGRRMCGWDKSLYQGFEGDKIWATLSVMALNIRKLLRDINK